MVYEIVLGRTRHQREKYGSHGTIFLGKHFVQMGQTLSLASQLRLDVGGPHVILCSGKRGSGKCVSGDTLITLSNGQIIRIDQLEDNTDNILSIGKNLKLAEATKSEFYKRSVSKLLRITLRSGKEIKLTPEHPLLTIKGWEDAQNLDIGSRIATPRKINAFGSNEMPEHEIKILAYLIAEGHVGNGFVLFSNRDKDIVKDFESSIKQFDMNLKVDKHSHPYCYRVSQIKKKYKYDVNIEKRNALGQFISGGVRYQKSSINKWLRTHDIYDKLSLDKFIPYCIFTLPKYQIALFLNRLFSCDGSVYASKTRNRKLWQISYSSSSESLAKQVQHLLLRFEILSKLRHKKVKCNGRYFDTCELVINSQNVIRFVEEIGFYGVKKQLEQQAVAYLSSLERNPNVDTIPRELWEIYRPNNWAEVGRAMNYAHPKAMRERLRYAPSRQTLVQIALADQNSAIYQLATSDIFWDEIVAIDSLYGKFDVYDFEVPEHHNFIANDIIIHNSYTLGVIAEGLASLPEEMAKNLSCILFDTMGIYWTMKYPNYRDDKLLKNWDLDPKKLKPVVFVPKGLFENYKRKGVPVDESFSIRPQDVGPEAWSKIFDIDINHETGVLLERVLKSLKGRNFSITDILKTIEQDQKASTREKAVLENRFVAAQGWGVFDPKGTELKELFVGGQTTVLDLSAYTQMERGSHIKSLVIGLICDSVLKQRLVARKEEEIKLIEEGAYLTEKATALASEKEPLIWMLIDESHEFIPAKGETLASKPLIQILREGRQPGITLVLATQQPGSIAMDALTQADIVISHRLTAKMDVEALSDVMQTYLPFALTKYIEDLPPTKGAAIVLDDKLEKIYPMQVRPRASWHGGEDPTAIPKELIKEIEAEKKEK